MDGGYKLEIVVPAGKVVEAEVSLVTLPTELGQVGILPHHVNYSTILGTGVLEYTTLSGESKKLVISGGFANFSATGLQVLADLVDLPGTVDITKLRASLGEVEQTLRESPTSSPEWIAAKSRVDRIEAIERL